MAVENVHHERAAPRRRRVVEQANGAHDRFVVVEHRPQRRLIPERVAAANDRDARELRVLGRRRLRPLERVSPPGIVARRLAVAQ
jgi:hypothetical protein